MHSVSVTCSFCDKSFANKYSLSSHISRYHRENRESDESSAILQPLSKAISDATDVKMEGPDSVCSDADTIVSEESQQGGSNSDVPGSGDDEFSDVTSSDDESNKEYSTNELESGLSAAAERRRRRVILPRRTPPIHTGVYRRTACIF